MDGKIAVVTGGSRGLGRSMALHLGRRGVGVVLTYRSGAAEARATVAEIEAVGAAAVALQLDTAETAGFPAFAGALEAALRERWGRSRFDHLVNNAGIGLHRPFAEVEEAEFDRLFAVNLKGVFFLTQRLLPLIEDGGRILNLSSGLARFSLPGHAAYAASKGAVEVLTRYLAKELGPRGISANTLAPGAIETDFGGGAVRDNPEINRQVAASTAMGRAGLPDDIGGAVAALLTGESNWMTGQRIEVSGGQNL